VGVVVLGHQHGPLRLRLLLGRARAAEREGDRDARGEAGADAQVLIVVSGHFGQPAAVGEPARLERGQQPGVIQRVEIVLDEIQQQRGVGWQRDAERLHGEGGSPASTGRRRDAARRPPNRRVSRQRAHPRGPRSPAAPPRRNRRQARAWRGGEHR